MGIPHYRFGRAVYIRNGKLKEALGLPAKYYQPRNWNKQ